MRSLLLLIVVLAGSQNAKADPLLAGAATADLTPGSGVLMDGSISKIGKVRGVHDRLHARAVVLQQGKTTLAIVINDMCLVEQPVYDAAKKIVHGKIGIPVSRMLMAATHSHATPRLMRIGTEPVDVEYHGLVAKRIAEAVIAAHGNLRPARVGFGSFEKRAYVKCRRFLCKEGTVGADPFGRTGQRVRSVAGVGGQVIRPAGPVDPEVSVLSLQHADGRPLAILGNFGVHYCGGYQRGMVSADYFGVYAGALAAKLDAGKGRPAFVGMMSNGTSGDVSSIRLPGKHKPWQAMHVAGTELAHRTLEVLPTIKHETPKTLAMLETELEVGVRKPDAKRIAWAKQLLADAKARGPHRWSRIFAAETLHLSRFPDRYKIKLQAIRIGEIAILAAPCEMFAETGLALKKHSPFENTFVISLANGCSGYLPTPQQLEWGGYETWPARTKHLENQAEPKIRKALLGMLSQLAGPRRKPGQESRKAK